MTRAITYLRVSTREQSDGYSLAAQRDACARYLAERGWQTVAEFCDAGESARSADRPQYQALLEFLNDHDVDALVVHKLDRLARNLEDHVALRARLRRVGVQLVSVTENLEDSPSGKLVEGIFAALNEFYAANLAQEVRKGQRQKLKEGGWPGKAPVGYRNVRSNDGQGPAVLVRDEDQAWLVRKCFELYASGTWAMHALQTEMARRGLRTHNDQPLNRSKVAALLRNPIYVGRMRWGGSEYPGTHEPLISDDLFARVQTLLDAKAQGGARARRHAHELTGLLRCGGCGARLGFTLAKGRFAYFFCLGMQRGNGCRQPYLPAARAEELATDLYRRIRLPDGWRSAIAVGVEEVVRARHDDQRRADGQLLRRRAQLDRDRALLLRAYYGEAIDTEQLRREQCRLDVEGQHLDALLGERARTVEHERLIVERAVALAGDLAKTYDEATVVTRRLMNHAVFEAIHVADAAVSAVDLTPGFAIVRPRASADVA